jgi:hypothetical protein
MPKAISVNLTGIEMQNQEANSKRRAPSIPTLAQPAGISGLPLVEDVKIL